MKKLKIFLWLFISSITVYASSIDSFTSDKSSYLKGKIAILNYKISDPLKYKLRFRAFDANGNIISPANFSAVEFGTTDFIIPNDYTNDTTIKIELDLLDPTVGLVDSRTLTFDVKANICQPSYKLISGDDSYQSLPIPFSFHGYTTIYPNENGYITFNKGEEEYRDYVKAFSPMIWTSSSDLMTNVYVTKCSNYVEIKWEGGYYPYWHGSFSSWVKLYKDGHIEQASGGYYGF